MADRLRNKRKITLAALMVAAMLLLSACAQAPLRLHVMANSDSEMDQQVKITVRDAVLAATKDGILECENAVEAREYIEENLEIILSTANDALYENGCDYSAEAFVGTYHFPDREYEGVCYPEGEYQALRIVLGSGQGHNWWCVMFPPLCISELEAQDDEVQYTSFFAELIHGWLEK